MLSKKWIIISMLGFASAGYASELTLGQLTYGGTGCPEGSISATLSPDSKSLSILFDEFSASVGGQSGKSFDYKSCNMAIPVKVPAGLSVSVYKFDYRGFNYLSQGSSSKFKTEYFFAGRKGPTIERQFSGELSQDFTITDQLNNVPYWSACGQSVIMRVNTHIQASSTNNAEAQISLDSVDAESKLIYHFDYKQCGDTVQCPSNKINTGFSCLDVKSRENFIFSRLYRVLLQRDGEESGINYWNKNGSANCSELSQQFMDGTKHNQGDTTEKKYDDRQFVTQLYRALLEREPDSEGLNYWTNALQHISRHDLVIHLSTSSEAIETCHRYGM